MHSGLRSNVCNRAGIAVLICLVLTLPVVNLVSCRKPPPGTLPSPITTPSVELGSAVSPLVVPTEAPADKSPDVSRQVTPMPSMAAMTGQIISTSTSQPMASTVVRLARVFWNEQHTDGAFVLEGARSPATVADDSGFFVFENLNPADYVLVVGEVLGDHVIVSEPDGSARIFTAEEDKVTDVGQIFVDLLAESR